MVSLDHLHDDLLCLIFSYVPTEDLLCFSNRTCRRFARTLNATIFWEKRVQSMEREQTNNTGHQQLTMNNMTIMQYQRFAMLCECLMSTRAMQDQPMDATMSDGASPQERPEYSNNNNIPQLPTCLEFGSLLTTRDRARQLRMGGHRTCVATSTDHARECIEQILPETRNTSTSRSSSTGNRWWSSRPTSLPNSTDVLVVATRTPLTVITHVRVKPLRDPFFPGVLGIFEGPLGRGIQDPENDDASRIVYSWKFTKIRAYHLQSSSASSITTNNDSNNRAVSQQHRTHAFREAFPCVWTNHRPDIMSTFSTHDDSTIVSSVPEDAVPVYESETIPVVDSMSDKVIEFTLPNVVANVVTIELLGKNHQQWPGSGFYCCVENLCVDGIPLLANAADMHENTAALTRQGLARITDVDSNGSILVL